MMTGADYAGVVNQHPKPGEPELYSRPEHPLTKDYAIVALIPGVEPGKKILRPLRADHPGYAGCRGIRVPSGKRRGTVQSRRYVQNAA